VKGVAGLLAAAAVLVAVELGMGAWSFGTVKSANPCVTRTSFPGGGLDAAVQRVVLDGLDGAACTLHTTREELVLSLSPSPSHKRVRWSPQTIDRAVRGGLVRAIDRAEARGDLPGPAAYVLRLIAREAPVEELIRGGSRLSNLFSGLLP
jgi:hypothetical protein